MGKINGGFHVSNMSICLSYVIQFVFYDNILDLFTVGLLLKTI